MRKKLIILIIIISLYLNGCVSNTEMENETLNFADNKVDLGQVKEYEEFVKDIDFENEHIKAEIKENLLLDTDITVNAPLNMGIYEYEDKEYPFLYDEEKNIEEAKKLAKLIDEYFGKDVTVIPSEQGIVNTTGSGYVNPDDEKYFVANQWEKGFPYYESEYDEQMINDIVNDFVNHFEELLPIYITTNYRCVHFTDAFWQKVNKEFVNTNFNNYGLDYYMVSLYSEIEQDVYIESDEQIVYKDIGESIRAEGFNEDNFEIFEQVSNSGVEILIDEYGQVFAFRIHSGLVVGECIDAKDILSAKEILGKVYELFAPYEQYGETIIREVRLKYIPYLSDEVNNNGYRPAYLIPVWSVKYNKRNEMKHNTIIFSAATGEILLRKILY